VVSLLRAGGIPAGTLHADFSTRWDFEVAVAGLVVEAVAGRGAGALNLELMRLAFLGSVSTMLTLVTEVLGARSDLVGGLGAACEDFPSREIRSVPVVLLAA